MTKKITENSSKIDSNNMLHGKVMVFGGKLLDNTPAIAKVSATAFLFQQEVCMFVCCFAGLLFYTVTQADISASGCAGG